MECGGGRLGSLAARLGLKALLTSDCSDAQGRHLPRILLSCQYRPVVYAATLAPALILISSRPAPRLCMSKFPKDDWTCNSVSKRKADCDRPSSLGSQPLSSLARGTIGPPAEMMSSRHSFASIVPRPSSQQLWHLPPLHRSGPSVPTFIVASWKRIRLVVHQRPSQPIRLMLPRVDVYLSSAFAASPAL